MTSEQNGSCQVIQCEGEVGIAQAAELKEAIAVALTEGTNVELDLQQVIEIDLTRLQVLVAAVRAAARESGFAPLPELGFERETEMVAACPR
jgi:anti-anti-sigma regulatory factor